MTTVVRTVEDCYTANRMAGFYWGSAETTGSFRSQVESGLLGGRYWIESTATYDDKGRQYMVAVFDPDTADITYARQDGDIVRFTSVKRARAWLATRIGRADQ